MRLMTKHTKFINGCFKQSPQEQKPIKCWLKKNTVGTCQCSECQLTINDESQDISGSQSTRKNIGCCSKVTLRLSGNSWRPAYPGFIVMKMVQVGFSDNSVPSKTNRLTPWFMAIWMHWICCAMTDSTSSSIRLNSSKHDQAPACAKPLKNLPIAL